MKLLRYLFAIILIGGMSSVAKADDFQMVVIDPTVSISLLHRITTDNFTFTFPSFGAQAGCKASQLSGLSPSTYLGCFTVENDTGATLTSLQMLIPVFNYQGKLDQPACVPVAPDVFSVITCGFTPDHKNYFLSFSGGKGIPSTVGNGDCDNDGDGGVGYNNDDIVCNAAAIFTIAEAGIPPGLFPPVQVTATAATPEPSSLLLLSTGVLSGGLFLANWRRRTLCTASSQSTDYYGSSE